LYIPLLILRYLFKRRIAWVSLLAVMLCSALVLIVLSVMGGWQTMFRESFRALTGDIVVHRGSMTGFDRYEELAVELKKLPGVQAMTPVIVTPGLVKIGNIEDFAQVMGFQTSPKENSILDPVDRVMKFRDSLGSQFKELQDKTQAAENASFQLRSDVPYEDLMPDAMVRAARNFPGMVVSAGLVGITRNDDGTMNVPSILYSLRARVTVVPSAQDRSMSDLRLSPQTYWIVDYSRTSAPQHDARNIYVPIERLQRDLGMTASSDGVEPARITELHIKTNPGMSTTEKLRLVDDMNAVIQQFTGDVMSFGALRAQTWEQRQANFLTAIEKERVLVTFLFSLISIVAVFLVFCIFYMIVVEKTRDIGIIKSVGATGWGVAKIFVGYGAIIGLVGGALGVLVGYLIVTYINEIHTLMGTVLGVQIWKAENYFFDKIPNQINWFEAGIIYLVAIVSATLGAIIPALRAAWLNPVEALRFE
jgi:lipoprotein-releasing system permease protein